MTFPVSHSTLDAGALARELQGRYGLHGDCRCRLVARGSNDFYRVEHADAAYALRVSRAHYRTAAELDYEIDLLAFLGAQRIAVPQPMPLASGERYFAVEAPEGARWLVLMSWVDGLALDRRLSAPDAEAAGELLGDIHLAAREFLTDAVRQIDTLHRITRQLPYVGRLLPPNSAGRRLFDAGLEIMREFFAGPAPVSLPRGATHGDFQFANLLKGSDGRLWAIDFDDCGRDILVKDLITFEWRARLERLSPDVIEAFRRGYERRRSLTSEEVAALPRLRVARDLYLLASYAAYIDRIGPVAGFEGQGRLIELLEEDLIRVEHAA